MIKKTIFLFASGFVISSIALHFFDCFTWQWYTSCALAGCVIGWFLDDILKLFCWHSWEAIWRYEWISGVGYLPGKQIWKCTKCGKIKSFNKNK